MPCWVKGMRRLEARYSAMRGRAATRSWSATSRACFGSSFVMARGKAYRSPATIWNSDRSTYDGEREQPSALLVREQALEVGEEPGQARAGEVGGAARGLGLLVLVVERAADRMMGVVRVDQPVG